MVSRAPDPCRRGAQWFRSRSYAHRLMVVFAAVAPLVAVLLHGTSVAKGDARAGGGALHGAEPHGQSASTK